MITEVVVVSLRMLVGTTFVLALIGKSADLRAFSTVVSGLAGIRARPARYVAGAVILLETLLAVVLLAWPPAATAGFALAAGLLAVFSLLLVRGLRRTYRPACNCFGAASRPLSGWDLVRNGVLVVACLAGVVLAPAASPSAWDTTLVALVALPAAAAGVALSNLHDIATTLRRPLPDLPIR